MIKQCLLVFYLLCLPITIWAQGTVYKRIYQENYDAKPLHFGFLFGFNSTNFSLQSQAAGYGLVSPRNFGFQIGGTASYAIHKHFTVKSGLNVALYERKVQYFLNPGQNPAEQNYLRESTWLELPLLVKFKSERRGNHRVFLVGGLKMGIEANQRRLRTLGSSLMDTKLMDLSLEYGFGLDKHFEFFNFSPEIRFSHGLFNAFNPSASTALINPYQPRIFSHSVSLILNFE